MLSIAWLALLGSCGTGIEVTEHVSDKDVKRVINQIDHQQPKATLDSYHDSVPAWQVDRKRFWVADNQVRLLLGSENAPLADSVDLSGHVLVYKGYDMGSIYDNRQTVNLLFHDEADSGRTYIYRTGKMMAEFNSAFSIPMLIDLDMVHHIACQIQDKDYYIRTPIWYDCQTTQMINGRHFIKVHIDSVLPGNAVMPLRVVFTTADTHQQAMVWMNENNKAMIGRDFDALFDAADPHLLFPTITDKNWKLITLNSVAEGMTKEECRLAIGSPKRINQNPDQGGMREYWYYDGGAYLYFVDGLLYQFRR